MRIRFTIVLALLLALLVSGSLMAQYEWEGNAVVGAYGEFPREGHYAASNTFPRNSVVVVTNIDTGAQTEVVITRRLDEPGIFMLLSEDAAGELEMRGDRPVRVRARPSYPTGITAVTPSQDLPYSPDPDINPAASAGDPNEAALRPDARRPLSAMPEPPAATTTPGVAPATEDPGAVATIIPTPSPRRPETTAEVPGEEAVAAGEAATEVEPAPEATVAAADSRGGITQGVGNAADRLVEPNGTDPVRSFPPPTTVVPVPSAPTPEAVPEEVSPGAEPASDTVDPGLGTQRPTEPELLPSVTPVPSLRETEAPEPELEVTPEAEDGPEPENRIERALQMVQSRMPKSRLFPAAEEDSVATFMPPQRPEEGELDVAGRLAEARLPSEEPAPAAPALVEVPETPEPEAPLETGPVAADVGPLDSPEEEVIAALPEAEPRIDRPAADHLGQIGAPEEEEEPEELLEAEPVPPEDAVLSLVPAEERPPVGPATPTEEEEPGPAEEPEVAEAAPAPTREPALSGSWAEANLPIVKSLREEAYYLQVGAYTNPESAKSAVDGLASDYPMAVLESSDPDRSVYRVFVGPLEADEQGTVLFFVRAKGYRDAFIRTGGR